MTVTDNRLRIVETDLSKSDYPFDNSTVLKSFEIINTLKRKSLAIRAKTSVELLFRFKGGSSTLHQITKTPWHNLLLWDDLKIDEYVIV